MNEQNNHAALTIAQQYPPAQYNLLVPMQTVTEIADIQKPVMNSVSISTNLNDGEIYEMEKAKDEWRDSKGYVHKATPAKYALTKKGLTKLMRAAGIKIISSRPVVPSTCQKCAEVNRSIGKPIRCGGCPNKDVKHEVRISVPQLTGENVTIVAHKEIAVEDVTAGMTEKQRAEFMKFRSEMCESKALNRALRTAMQIKSSYLIEEFKKPFVVAYLVPNLDNPAVREEAVKSMFGAANDLYGSRPKTSHTVYVDDDDDGYVQPEPDFEAVPEQPQQEQPPERPAQRPRQQQPAPSNRQQGRNGDSEFCADCGKQVGLDVAEYSRKQKIVDQIYTRWSEQLRHEAAHVSVAVAGPARYNAKKLDHSDTILRLSSEFVEWFNGLQEQVWQGRIEDKNAKEIARLVDDIKFCIERPTLNPTASLCELANKDPELFMEYYEKLHEKYRWRKNSVIAKLYAAGKEGKLANLNRQKFFEDENLVAYTMGDRAYIKFVMKPRQQLIVALKSRKWWWNSNEEAWSTYLNKLDKEWVQSISTRYADYV